MSQTQQSQHRHIFFDNKSKRQIEGYRLGNNPYGDYFCIPFILISVAWVMSICANQLCRFMYREITFDDATHNELVNLSQFYPPANTTVGLWSYQGVGILDGICFRYTSSLKLDDAFRAARAFDVLVYIFGFITMFRIWFALCIPLDMIAWKCIGIYLLLCCLFESLTFLQFNSNAVCSGGLTEEGYVYHTNCKLEQGSRFAIAAIVLWFLSSVCVFRLQKPSFGVMNDFNDGSSGMTIAVKKITTTTETIDKDGENRTVKTTEHLEYV